MFFGKEMAGIKRLFRGSGRPSLARVFASRSESIAVKDRAQRLWREMHNTRHFSWLQNQENYQKQMPEKIVWSLQSFVTDWMNKRALLEARMDDESKLLAKKKGTGREKAYGIVLQKRQETIERHVKEKVALDQLAWVLARHKKLMAMRRRIDPLEAGPCVRALAHELRTSTDKAAAFVRLAKKVSGIQLISTHSAIADAYYGLPTAEETLMANGIIVGELKGKAAWGCGMLCNVMNAALSHAKWENKQVRTVDRDARPHSIIIARIPKTTTWLVADPYSSGHMFLHGTEGFRGSDLVSQVGQYLREEIEKLRRRGLWKEGGCQKDLVGSVEEYRGGR